MSFHPPSIFQGAYTVLIPSTEERDGVTFYGIQLPDVSSSPVKSTSQPLRPSTSTSSLLRPTCFRRYSEFDTLERTLRREFPQLQWHRLPPKTWTKPNAKVIHARQLELAKYLTSILNVPELKETSLVLDFLGLPAIPKFSSTTSWPDRFREVHQALIHWKQQSNQCDQSTLQGMRSFQLIQSQIQKEWARVAMLEKELDDLTITPMEKTRRCNLLTNLQHEFQTPRPTSPHLLTTNKTSTKSTSPRKPPTVVEQHRTIDAQDRLAGDLAQVIQRQKQVALQMNESLQEHTGLLEELKLDLNQVGKKVDGASKQTKRFT